MSENNILLGVFILCLICYLCSCCYVSCILGTFFTGVSDNNNHNSIGRQSCLESPDGKYTLSVYPYDKYEEYMTIQSGDATKLLFLPMGNLVLTDDNNTIYCPISAD